MDFAKKQLEKYGWQEGKGLGKNENGINVPLKPSLKFDSAGIGHNSSEQFTNNWWENLYNKASDNLNITTSKNDTIQVKVKNPDAVEISTKNYSVKNLKNESNGLQYGSFIKTSQLTADGIVDLDNNYRNIIAAADITSNIVTLSDEQLFAACGGRTAHKGARHGLKLNGKLSRLEKQEKLLLKKLKKVNLSDEVDSKSSKKSLEKKLKKIDNHKNKNKSGEMEEDINILSPTRQFVPNTNSPQKCSKKRKKERKRVSFSETVTEYQTQDLQMTTTTTQTQDIDSSSQSDGSSRPPTPVTTVRQIKIKDINENSDNNANLMGDLDEGIDCSDYDATKEKDANDLQVKIRKDNKRMKRKLNKLRKQEEELQTKNQELSIDNIKIEETEEESLDATEKCVHCTKRKINFDAEDCETIEAKKCHFELKGLTKRQLKKYYKKQKRLEKRIAKVTDSFNQVCKISDVESE